MLMEKSCFLESVTVLLLHLFIKSLTMAVADRSIDQSALLSLKAHITLDPHNILVHNWSTSSSVCNWIGVSCSAYHQRVTALNLSYMDLNGTIPPQMGNLTFLSLLSIRNNSFYGSLPDELAHLHHLENLDFGFNFLSGVIPPGIWSLPKLKIFVLERNDFMGNIPSSLWNTSSSQKIDLGRNLNLGSLASNVSNGSPLQLINLSFNGLSGPLPVDMFDHLSQLSGLYLSGNQLSGQIPGSLFKCRQLQVLSLSYNNLAGSIPMETRNLTMLRELYLNHNYFTGAFPSEIGYLTNLKNLSISNNHLRGGIPSSIGNCSLLREINFNENNLTGEIPVQIGHLSNLEALRGNSNSLNGHIPPMIFNSSRIRVINLHSNHLSGSLPPSTGLFLPNLVELVLCGNELGGLIPNSISNASQLTLIDLSDNSFTGFIPSNLGNLLYLQRLNLANNYLTSKSSSSESGFFSSLTSCKYLRRLELSGNPLSESIPVSFGNLSSSLEYFLGNGCKYKGSIPGEVGNLSSLIALKLGDNELSGIIPATIGRLKKLQGLYLQGNRLEGIIPYELCHLNNLVDLSLGGNKLSGSIPECLGDLTNLRNLSLHSNILTSSIPLTLWRLKDILALNISSNSLNGSLSSNIGNLTVVTEIDFSRNQLSGNIPMSIGDLQNLVHLSLAKNRLEGPIPESFNHSTGLEFLDLSYNNLSGVFPKSLRVLFCLKYFNVSYNKLEGLPNIGPMSASLCMMNKVLNGVPSLHVPPWRTRIGGRSLILLLLKCLLPITVSVYPLWLIYALIRYKKRETDPLLQTDRRISYEEILLATDGFSESNLLGKGGFGSVYRGTLKEEMNVAIKVFNVQRERGFLSFQVESEVMQQVRHPNLVKVLNCCSTVDFRALVLEYMPNGTLDKWLHTHNYFLNVLQRLEIMIDTASAIEYLHHGSSRSILHCDLKPSNILLDEDMVARVSDFSIAKLFGEGNILKQTQTSTLGTFGYMAPEYGSNGIVSTKSDVYSFGILMMETFTRKKPTDDIFGEEMNLKCWITESLPDAVEEVVDVTLLQTEQEHYAAKTKCMSSILRLALSCSAESPAQRIDITNALHVLEGIKRRFLWDIEGRE